MDFSPGVWDEDDADGCEPEAWPETSAEELAAARAQALWEALSGPHRVFLSTPAGPGSLCEALKALEASGRVACAFVDDGRLGPHLLYAPVS